MILDSAVDRSEIKLTMSILMYLCTNAVFTHWVSRYRAQSTPPFACGVVTARRNRAGYYSSPRLATRKS